MYIRNNTIIIKKEHSILEDRLDDRSDGNNSVSNDVSDFLRNIRSKKEMHEIIDNLQEGDKGVMLVFKRNEEKEINKYVGFGDMTIAESYYLVGCFQNYLLGNYESNNES